MGAAVPGVAKPTRVREDVSVVGGDTDAKFDRWGGSDWEGAGWVGKIRPGSELGEPEAVEVNLWRSPYCCDRAKRLAAARAWCLANSSTAAASADSISISSDFSCSSRARLEANCSANALSVAAFCAESRRIRAWRKRSPSAMCAASADSRSKASSHRGPRG